jgi:hypothetical protein
MSSPFTVPPPALDATEIKRRQAIIMMRAVLFFLVVSALLVLLLPLPLPLPLRAAVAGCDLIAALVVYAIYRQRIKVR